MNHPAHNDFAAEFDRDGFAIVKNVFSPREIADIASEVDQFVREIAPRLGAGEVYYEDSPGKPVKALHGMNRHSEFFRRLKDYRRLRDIVEQIWPGQEIISEAASFFGKPARDGSVTPAHQDNAFHAWDPPLALTLTIAIDESTNENGALICFAGSHRAGLLPHKQSGVMGFSRCLIDAVDTARYPEVPLYLKPGDVAVHNFNTVHRSEANRSAFPRRTVAVTYRSALARQDTEAVKKYQEMLKHLHDVKAAS